MLVISIVIIAFLFGLCFGSFANVVIYRIPKNISIIKPPSHCPSCSKRLGVIDLIPFLSWFYLLGKCRSCKNKISPVYPLVELLCGLLFASVAYYSFADMDTPTLTVFPLAVFMFVLLTVSFIDAYTQEIPDGLVITGAVAGIVWVAGGHFLPEMLPFAPAWSDALLGVLAGAAPLLIIDRITILLIKKDGFGYGDVKLMAMVGLFLGWKMILMSFFMSFVFGAVYAVYLMASGKAKRGAYMPFGPFLCMGILGAFWAGELILDWYLGVLL
jgi:prepilin signal peptidase PulO-like enzyme (type II secretory pathway)